MEYIRVSKKVYQRDKIEPTLIGRTCVTHSGKTAGNMSISVLCYIVSKFPILSSHFRSLEAASILRSKAEKTTLYTP